MRLYWASDQTGSSHICKGIVYQKRKESHFTLLGGKKLMSDSSLTHLYSLTPYCSKTLDQLLLTLTAQWLHL